MFTLILFAVFNQINFFVGLVFGGIGLAVDIFLIKSLLSLFQNPGTPRSTQKSNPAEEYIKKSPLEEQADEVRRHNQAMEAVAAQMLKEQRNAALRAQQQASMEKSKRHRAYLAARNEYNHAAMQYESYSKQGLTQDALRWKRHMDEAYAEMLRNN